MVLFVLVPVQQLPAAKKLIQNNNEIAQQMALKTIIRLLLIGILYIGKSCANKISIQNHSNFYSRALKILDPANPITICTPISE